MINAYLTESCLSLWLKHNPRVRRIPLEFPSTPITFSKPKVESGCYSVHQSTGSATSPQPHYQILSSLLDLLWALTDYLFLLFAWLSLCWLTWNLQIPLFLQLLQYHCSLSLCRLPVWVLGVQNSPISLNLGLIYLWGIVECPGKSAQWSAPPPHPPNIPDPSNGKI